MTNPTATGYNHLLIFKACNKKDAMNNVYEKTQVFICGRTNSNGNMDSSSCSLQWEGVSKHDESNVCQIFDYSCEMALFFYSAKTQTAANWSILEKLLTNKKKYLLIYTDTVIKFNSESICLIG